MLPRVGVALLLLLITPHTRTVILCPTMRTTHPTQKASTWYAERLAKATGSTNITANMAEVSKQLQRYFALSAELFGSFAGRLPPEPDTDAKLAAMNGTFIEFVRSNGLQALEPFFYQFFTLQGMGSMAAMPAYYGLKWCNTLSINRGGFGNDMDTPLAMLVEGYGAILDGL